MLQSCLLELNRARIMTQSADCVDLQQKEVCCKAGSIEGVAPRQIVPSGLLTGSSWISVQPSPSPYLWFKVSDAFACLCACNSASASESVWLCSVQRPVRIQCLHATDATMCTSLVWLAGSCNSTSCSHFSSGLCCCVPRSQSDVLCIFDNYLI